MTKPSTPCAHMETLLPWYLNGSLQTEEQQAVRAHLADCAACQAELAETRTACELFDQHLPLEILEKLALAEDPQTAVADSAVSSHLSQCEACQEQVTLMKASWVALQAEPDLKPFHPASAAGVTYYRWGLALAAMLLVALGLGWYNTYRAIPQAPTVAKLQPQSNLVAKDLFPVELARRSDAGANIPLFEGFSGIALTLHTQMESPAFDLEIRDAADTLLWNAARVLAQENGTLSILVPANLVQESTLSLLLRAEDGREEHYRLTPQRR